MSLNHSDKHLSKPQLLYYYYLAELPGEMIISWMTRKWTPSEVFHGLHPDLCDNKSEGEAREFVESSTIRYAHKVILTNLKQGMTHCNMQ